MINKVRFQLAIKIGIFSVVMGLIVFTLNRKLLDYLQSSIPRYSILVWPGNLSLDLIWHPPLTEEINFWVKLGLSIGGQCAVTSVVSYGLLCLHQTTERNLSL